MAGYQKKEEEESLRWSHALNSTSSWSFNALLRRFEAVGFECFWTWTDVLENLQVSSSVCEVILELGESETNVKYEVAWPKAVHHCIHGLVLWYLLSLSSLAEDFRDLLVLSQSKQILAIWRFLALSHKTAGWPNKASGQHKAAPTGASQCLTFKSWKSMSGAKVAKVKGSQRFWIS